jgi:hypothetical protein
MAWYDDWLKNRVQGQIEELLKADGVSAVTEVPPGGVSSFASPETPAGADGDKLPDIPEADHDAGKQIGRKAYVDDPYFDMIGTQVNYKFKLTRISNKTLKEVSVRDWLISAIIQCRVDTLLRFSRPEHRRFEMGFRIIKRDFESHYTPEEKDEISAIEDFVYNCGRKEGTPHDDKRNFGEFLKVIGRDALTFGHVAIEKVKTRAGGLHRFRPLPGESMYLINKSLSKEQVSTNSMKSYQLTKPKSNNDPKTDQVVNEVENDYIKYVQISYDNRPLATFGDEDCIWKLFNPQNFSDSLGYCYSPLELAIINITNHLNVENYNANFFTHGYAARGVLHLKGTVTQQQLANFRRTFYNSITGHQNAWRTPIVAGLDEVQWVPMSANAKEMEYLNYNNHLMRILCAQFQIDPVELGLDYLISSNGRAPMQQASNEYKIIYSRERGLVPLLMFIEDIMNADVLMALDPAIAAKYKFVFTGMTEETPQTEIAQMQAEMTVWKTMNDLLKQAQKDKIDQEVADLPLNQAFWALVEKNYTRGEIREKFFGDKDASKRRELQYIPGDPSFLNWNQFIATIDAQKKQEAQMASQQDAAAQEAQMKMTQEQQKHDHAEAAHGRDKEKHTLEMEQIKAKAASDAVQHGLKDTAKQFGASKASNVGGQEVANPMNKNDGSE